MNAKNPALNQLAESLAALAQSGEPSQLREYLSGRRLPAMGGDLDPAEIIARAIAFQSTEIRQGLARLLASIISEEADRNELLEGENGLRKSSILFSAFYLASELPAETSLFYALKDLERRIQDHWGNPWIPLWQALVYQQTDQSLQVTWLRMLWLSRHSWNQETRALLLTCWRGLLWVPPGDKDWQTGRIINFSRLSRGLLSVFHAVSRHGEEGLALLQACLDILVETYPRSGEFWAENFLPYLNRWPEELSEIVAQRWPPPLAHARMAG